MRQVGLWFESCNQPERARLLYEQYALDDHAKRLDAALGLVPRVDGQ